MEGRPGAEPEASATKALLSLPCLAFLRLTQDSFGWGRWGVGGVSPLRLLVNLPVPPTFPQLALAGWDQTRPPCDPEKC